jgi:hypothetical protein
MSLSQDNLKSIFGCFQHIDGAVISVGKFGSGLINDTYKICVLSRRDEKNQETCYILQRINHDVFTRPVQVMENITRVTRHLAEKIHAGGGDVSRETLTLVPTKKRDDEEEHFFVQDNQKNYWRLYDFISGVTAFEIGEIPNKDASDTTNPFLRPRQPLPGFNETWQTYHHHDCTRPFLGLETRSFALVNSRRRARKVKMVGLRNAKQKFNFVCQENKIPQFCPIY